MRKTVHKGFWVWNFDKEEKWLNEMAAKGLALTAVGFCRYEFEDCIPGEYKVCLMFLEKNNNAENERYIEFVEGTGAEHVGTFARWAYFRKKTTEENFAMFSDNGSRVKHLTRIIHFIALLCGINFYIGCYNLFMYFFWKNSFNIIGILNMLISVFAFMGILHLLQKRKKLKNEQNVFE